MVMDNIFGQMEAIIKGISFAVSEKETEFGRIKLEIVINMRENIYRTKNMVLVFLRGRLEISIKEIIFKMKDQAMAKCFGMMEAIIKVNG
jgi:hypothetical protein